MNKHDDGYVFEQEEEMPALHPLAHLLGRDDNKLT